jgi:uncharacterized protein
MLPALTEKELDRLEDLLIKYGNDLSVLNIAELHGFFTALASSVPQVTPERWLPVASGGKVPKFKTPSDEEAYTALMLRFASDVASELANGLDSFEPLFEETLDEEEPVTVMEEWCFGYMRGVQVAGWGELPLEQAEQLSVISLHGFEDNFELLDAMTPEQLQDCVPQVVEAAKALYRYQRSQA